MCCDIWFLGLLQALFRSISQHTPSGIWGRGCSVCHVNSCFKVERLGPRTSDKYCAAILPVLGLDPASGVRYRSTQPGNGARGVRWSGSLVCSGCLTSSVLRYLDFGPPPGLVLSNIAAHYPQLRIPGGPEIWSLPHAPGWASKSVDYFGDVQ